MLVVGIRLLLGSGGTVLYKGNSSAKISCWTNLIFVRKIFIGKSKRMVWVTVNDHKVEENVHVMFSR